MDRLHAAIQKARAARETVLSGRGPGASSSRGRRSGRDHWAELVRFDPDPHHLREGKIVTREDGAKSAPFDVLRTRVLQQVNANGWSRVAVTSPGPGCGKSTVTLNLAFSLARQPDVRTIVIDLDLRRPMLARLLGLDMGHEVAGTIRNQGDPSDQMVRVGENLAFATTAQAVRDPSSLIRGRGMTAFLDRLAADFAPDLILLDLPPVMVSDDAIAFMPHADAALIVAAAEQSTLRDVDACEQELASQTNVMGVVLNKCAHPGEGHGYGYGYGYGEDEAA